MGNHSGLIARKPPSTALKGTTAYVEIYQSYNDERLYYVDQNGIHRLLSSGNALPELVYNGAGIYTHFDGNILYQQINVNASALPYDNNDSGLAAITIQDAIDELTLLANHNIYTEDGVIADVNRTVSGAHNLIFSQFSRVSFFEVSEFRIEAGNEVNVFADSSIICLSPTVRFITTAGDLQLQTALLSNSLVGAVLTLVDDVDGSAEWSTFAFPTPIPGEQNGYVLVYDEPSSSYVLTNQSSLSGSFDITDGITVEEIAINTGSLLFGSSISPFAYEVSAGTATLVLDSTGAALGQTLTYDGSNDLVWTTVNLNNLFTANLTLAANRSHSLSTFDFKIAHSAGSIIDMKPTSNVVGFISGYMQAVANRIDFIITGGTVITLTAAAIIATTDVQLRNNKSILFYESTVNGLNNVGFTAPASLVANTLWTLPVADGTSGQVLSTNGLGILSWSSAALSFAFTLTDGTTSQSIANTDTFTVTGINLISTVVSATDTLTVGINFSGATAGQVVGYNGTNVVWITPVNTNFNITDGITNIAMTTGGSFLISSGTGIAVQTALSPNRVTISLNAGIDDLTDVSITAVAANQFLRYDGSAWTNQTISLFTGFSITDGSTTEVLSSGNTITFSGIGLITAAVLATDTVRYSINISGLVGGEIIHYNGATGAAEWGAASSLLSFAISDGVITQTVVSGNTILFVEGNGISIGVSAVDTITIALDASLSNLTDVDPALTPSNGQVLTYNGGTSRWEASSAAGGYSFIITNGTVSQTISNGNTLLFVASGTGLTVAVSATDTVTYTISTVLSWATGTSIITVNNETVVINKFAYNSTEQVYIGNPLAAAGSAKLVVTGDASSAPLIQLYGYEAGSPIERFNITESGIGTLTSKGSGSLTLTGEVGTFTQKLIINSQRTVSTNTYGAVEFTNIADRDFALIYGNSSTPYLQIFAYDISGSTAYQKPVLTAFTENSNATAGRIYIGGRHGASAGASGLYEWAQTSPRHDIVLHTSRQGVGKAMPLSGTIWLIDPSVITVTDTYYNSPTLSFMTRSWDGAAEREIENNLVYNLWIKQTSAAQASDGFFTVAVSGLGGMLVNRTLGMNSDGAVAVGYNHTSVTWSAHAFRVYANIHSGNILFDGYTHTREDSTSPDNLLYTNTIGLLQSVAFEDIFLERTNSQSGTTYTLVITDQSKTIQTTNAGAVVITIPLNASVPFPIGTSIELFQYGAGQLSVAITVGGTLRQPDGNKIVAIYNRAVLTKINTDEWDIQGALTV